MPQDNSTNNVKKKQHEVRRVPSERQPQLLLCKDSKEVNKAEAVALCNGVKDTCTPANCSGILNSNNI